MGSWVGGEETWGHLLPADHGESFHSSDPTSSAQAKCRPGHGWGAGWDRREVDRSGVEPSPPRQPYNQTNPPSSPDLHFLVSETEAATLDPRPSRDSKVSVDVCGRADSGRAQTAFMMAC